MLVEDNVGMTNHISTVLSKPSSIEKQILNQDLPIFLGFSQIDETVHHEEPKKKKS